MADAWVHAVLSLIAFGKTYFDLHKQIDSWSQELGYEHRVMVGCGTWETRFQRKSGNILVKQGFLNCGVQVKSNLE